jgi:hypothetical protein
MFRNELEFRDFVATLLEKEGFSVQKEFGVPEGYRVDLLAIKDGVRSGIEVKVDARRISDDISKGTVLHRLPEFDHIYVAAPRILISSDLIGYAKRVRIGLIGVREDSIEWLQGSEKLKPAELLGGAGLPNQLISPGSIFKVSKNVENHGEKVARHLEVFFMRGGPFATAPKEKSRYRLPKLSPGESWKLEFRIKVKKSAKPGTYPLYLCCAADGVKASDNVFDIKIGKEHGNRN